MTKRILLCDDEFHIVRAAEIKFQRRGFEVRTASDGEEAWEIMQNWVPDVLVTDCQMPRLDGLGLVERLRGAAATADLPVLLLTAKSFEKQYRERAEALRVLRVMAKPFSPRELLIQVEQIVEQSPRTATSDDVALEAGSCN
ncbi:MAG: response regulator [Planctomycetota bacterium]|nr:MAG: response regulator [Planctomycetota bacterium]REJ94563.1 MAG: response regulator [Planctomycetota bacterium]REK18574.1 MAG: response regulator [Planctomycetota bacterium]REK37469.1 MAG: response regulator [Planctomycetota bacterium]